MLALVREAPGVLSAAIDESGTYLRLRLDARERRMAVQTVQALVRERGYETVVAGDGERERVLGEPRRWFERDSVHELSREEAAMLARDIADAFAGTHALDLDVRERVRQDLERGLKDALAARSMDASIEDSLQAMLSALRAQVRSYLAAPAAEALEVIARRRLLAG